MAKIIDCIVAYSIFGGWLIAFLFLCALVIWVRYFNYLFLLREKLNKSNIDQFIEDHEINIHGTFVGATSRSIRFVQTAVKKGVDFREAFEISKESELSPFSGQFRDISSLVTVAPLLGLLGTVSGMIVTFAAITEQGSQDISVALGISRALITTQAGLAVAIPGAFALVHLRRRYRHLLNLFDRNESRLVTIFTEVENEEA